MKTVFIFNLNDTVYQNLQVTEAKSKVARAVANPRRTNASLSTATEGSSFSFLNEHRGRKACWLSGDYKAQGMAFCVPVDSGPAPGLRSSVDLPTPMASRFQEKERFRSEGLVCVQLTDYPEIPTLRNTH